MHLVSALSANVLALSLAVLSATTAAAPNRVEEFCDWQPGQELNTVQNTVRRADTTSQETKLEFDPEIEKLIKQLWPPEPVDDGRVINVGVHMHVVGKPQNNESEFLIDRTALDKQLDFLNESFKPANISFTLSSADWTKGGMLARGIFLRRPLAKSLHRGNFSELNIFFCDDDETIGGSTVTLRGYDLDDDDDKSDGCVVNANTVPGGPHPVWNLGVTVVHEVGHWFGLWHTDLTDPGDCEPNWRNATGLSNDACLTEFTSEQIAEMRKFARKERGL
ncbi:Extracellular metalloprotease [Metarhizium anisopliae]|nr:Extracellular metalloprotease [Metarhizium anisopliae]